MDTPSNHTHLSYYTFTRYMMPLLGIRLILKHDGESPSFFQLNIQEEKYPSYSHLIPSSQQVLNRTKFCNKKFTRKELEVVISRCCIPFEYYIIVKEKYNLIAKHRFDYFVQK